MVPKFVRDLGERVISSAAQAALAVVAAAEFNLLDIKSLAAVAVAAGTAALLAALKALAARSVGDPTSASLDPRV